MESIRLIVSENQSLTLLGLMWVVEKQPDIEIVASYDNATDTIKAINKDDVDVVIIDSNLPDLNGLDIVNVVQQIGCRVVVSIEDCNEEILSMVMQNNIDCLFLKSSNPNLLPQAIRCAYHKDSWIDPEISKKLMQHWAKSLDNSKRRRYKKGRSNYDYLTETEINILKLIACGYSYEEMANQTFITLATIRCHANSIYSKLGVNNRVRAIIKGIKLKYLNVSDLKDTDTEETVTYKLAAIQSS